MPEVLVEGAGTAAEGDPRNARALAAAAQIAYFEPAQAQAAFRDELGMVAQFVSVSNTQAYVASNAEHVVVAFRGSQGPTGLDGLKDWFVTNAVNLLIQPQGPLSTEFLAAGVGARWHQGFVGAITDVWPALWPVVDAELAKQDRPLWVTGHSLGGALALLGSWLLLRNARNPAGIYTFGAPMVGNSVVAAALDREFTGRIYRYRNPADPIPLLPMMSLVANQFTHCHTEVLLGAGAQVETLKAFLAEAAGGLVQGVLTGDLAERVWAAVKSRVMAHLLNDYRKLLPPVG